MWRTSTSVSSVWAATLSARVLKVSNVKVLFLFSIKNFGTCYIISGEKNQCVTLITQKGSCYDFSVDTGTVIVYLKIKILELA
jgi:hypothetical protein